MALFEKVLQDGRKSQKGDFYVLRKPENVVRVIYERSYELMTLSLYDASVHYAMNVSVLPDKGRKLSSITKYKKNFFTCQELLT